MKRRYKLVSYAKNENGFALALDGKPVRTPGAHDLIAPNEDIAAILMAEWSGQGDMVKPETMPFTQMLSTKFDRVIPQRTEITSAILKYLDTDLICYRTSHPPELKKLQEEAWDPWLDWFEAFFGVPLNTTLSLSALTHPPAAQEKAAASMAVLDDDRFNILQLVTAISGSLILALAFVKGKIAPDDLFAAMRVEEGYKARLYDEEKYGPEALQEKRDQSIRFDLNAARLFLSLL